MYLTVYNLSLVPLSLAKAAKSGMPSNDLEETEASLQDNKMEVELRMVAFNPTGGMRGSCVMKAASYVYFLQRIILENGLQY